MQRGWKEKEISFKLKASMGDCMSSIILFLVEWLQICSARPGAESGCAA